MKTIEIPSPIQDEVKKISESYDRTENDLIDTSLLNNQLLNYQKKDLQD